MRRLNILGNALLVALVLVICADYTSFATTGHSFLLGSSNSANKATGLSRTTSGTVLTLHSKSAANPPLAVNGGGRVANLNADRVDGLDSSTLRTHSYVFRSSFSTQSAVVFTVPVPNGSYVVTYSGEFGGIASGTALACRIQETTLSVSRDTGVSTLQLSSTPTYDPAVSGTGVVTKVSGGKIDVVCQVSSGTFSTNVKAPLEIVATPTTLTSSQNINPD